MLAWAKNWTTLAFPMQVRAVSPITLQLSGTTGAKVPVRPGLSIYALQFVGERLLVGLKPTSNTFTQTVPVDATNFVEAITPRYRDHVKRLAVRAANTPTQGSSSTSKPGTTKAKPPSSSFPRPPSKPPTPNPHGNFCVCDECKAKKKGGSLFPDLPGQ